MTPDEWRRRVGQHLEHRREQVGYSSRYQVAEGVDLSESWVRQIESGEVRRNDGTIATPNPRGNKLRLYLDRLEWPPDTIERLLAGDDPTTIARQAAGTTEETDLRSTVERLADLVERLDQTIRDHWPPRAP